MIGVAQREPQIVRRGDCKIDGLADRPAQQIFQRHHELIGIDAFRDQRLSPRKGQQAMGERRGAVRRCHRGIDIARNVVGPPLAETGLQQIQRSHNSSQEIVEVVCDAAGQLPHRFHLLRLQQCLLGDFQPFGRGLLRGHVAGNRINVILVRYAGPRQPAVRSVLVPEAALEPDGGVAAAELVDLRPRHPAIIGMLQPFRSTVQQFSFAPAQRSGACRVDRSPDAVAIRDHQKILRHVPDPVALPGLFLDALRQRRIQLGELVRKLAVSLFALPQRLLRHHLLGDIGVRADQTDGPPLLVALDRGFDRNPARLAVAGANNPITHGVVAHRAGDSVAEFLLGGFAVLGMDAP